MIAAARAMTAREACIAGLAYMAGCFIATGACLACGWLDRRNTTPTTP